MATTKKFLALSIDGGGFRGLYTASLLQRLSTLFAKEEIHIDSRFQLISGTSTGGIIACALAAGIPISQIINFYKEKGRKIFLKPKPTNSLCLKWVNKAILYFWAMRRTPSCDENELRESLREVFGAKTFSNIYQERKISLCIPAVDISNNSPVVFKTSHNQEKCRDDDLSLVDACLATSAAPIFFPVAKIKNWSASSSERRFIDGGLWANNPVLVSLIEALELTKDEKEDINIIIISIGTASPQNGNLQDKTNLSAADWGFGSEALISSLDAQSIGFNYMASLLSKNLSTSSRKITIVRLPTLDKGKEYHERIALDRADESAIRILQQMANIDAENIHGLALRGNPESEHLKSIFNNK